MKDKSLIAVGSRVAFKIGDKNLVGYLHSRHQGTPYVYIKINEYGKKDWYSLTESEMKKI